MILPTHMRRLVPMNIGIISAKYHFIRTMVFVRTVEMTGILSVGTAITKTAFSSGMSFFAANPDIVKTAEIEATQIANARGL